MAAFGFARLNAARWLVVPVTLAAVLAAGIAEAEAAKRKKKRIGPPPAPPFAHIVVDANTGEVLDSLNADARRFPASLTKVMTLYLLFEQIEAGKLRLDSPLPVSRHAASRPPTKLGLKPGTSITVETAIKALVTRSANDAAVVVAEAIGRSEANFARQMTEKARELGMHATVYRNASGLPNSGQVTTAHDQALLGRAIQERFPRYYRYFATSRFQFRGRTLHNHNRLLGTVRGVDGIKTGYTRASGYNLVSSVHRGGRHIVAVVLGGRTSKARDKIMRDLIEKNIREAVPDEAARGIAAARLAAVVPPLPPARPLPRDSGEVAAAESPVVAEAPALAPVLTATQPAEPTADVDAGPQSDATAPRQDLAPMAPAVPAAAASVPEPAHRGLPLIRSARADPLGPAAPVHGPAEAGAAAEAAALFAALADLDGGRYPGAFPYLLVAFVACVGSLVSALRLALGHLLPRRRVA